MTAKKPPKKVLTEAELKQRRDAAAARTAAANARHARIAAGELTWAEEVKQFGAGFVEWRERCKGEGRGDPVGFFEELLSGNYQVNAESLGGDEAVGLMAFVPRHTQRLWAREICWHRWSATDDRGWARYQEVFPSEAALHGRPQGRFMRLVIKGRRAYVTTGNVMIGICDGTVNAGANMAVSSYDVKEGLENVSELIRIALHDDKAAAPGAKGIAQKRFKTRSKSLIRLLSPGESMGRGFSYNFLLWTEVDYLEDISGALKSVLPSIRKDAFGCVVLESTMRRDAATGFKDYIQRTLRGETAFRIWFQPWWWDTTAVLEPTEKEQAALAARESLPGADGYEFKTLRDKLGLTDKQLAWWRHRFKEDADYNLDDMLEIYPALLDEAMAATKRGEFLYQESLDWIKTTLREPIARYRVTNAGLTLLEDERDWGEPHLMVYAPPESGEEYWIGADTADESARAAELGSENALYVTNKNTGEQMAEWSGDATAPEFAIALHQTALYFNEAWIDPESNVGVGVINYLVNVLQYHKVCKRENPEQEEGSSSNLFGFYTSAKSRPWLVSLIQDAVNGCKALIRSKKLLEQLIDFAKRRGRPQKKQSQGGVKDDLVMAFGLSLIGHDGLTGGHWRSWRKKEAPRPKAHQQNVVAPRGYVFDDEDRDDLLVLRRGMNRS